MQFNDNGAWSWFQDERAIIDPATNQLLVSSVASGDGVGGTARDGNVDLVAYNLTTSALSRTTLIDFSFLADDHFSAALLTRPDGRYLAVYAAHQNDSLVRWRVSTNPGDATSWSPEQSLTLTSNQGTTYSNVYYLSGSNKVYDFFRGNNYDPHVLSSTDQGGSFSYSGHLLMDPGNSAGQRPYVKYTSNGTDRVYFITTEAHPRDANTGIYAGYMTTDGHLHKLDGSDIGTLGTNTGTAVSATGFTTVLAPNQVVNGTTRTRAWTTDIQLDSTGKPYMLFTSRVNNADTDHRFYYARWNGSGLVMTELGKAGGFLYAAENDYTGLGALDPSDPNTLYISTKIDPRDGTTTTNKYEIYRGFTNDGGLTWAWTPFTTNSASDNLRPIMPKWDATHSALLWFQGTYTTYQHFNSAVVGKFFTGANGIWKQSSGGAWDNGGNWQDGRIGTGLALIADFSTMDYSGGVSVTNPTPRTLGVLTTGDQNATSVSNLIFSGAGITLDGGVVSPEINVKSQTTTIDLPLAGTQGLIKSGAGSLVLAASNTYTGPTLINSGALVIAHPDAVHGSLNVGSGAAAKIAPGLSHAVVLNSLSIGSAGTMDLADNDLVIDYTGAPGTLENEIRQHLSAGRLLSSAGGLPPGTRVGYADNALLGNSSFGGVSVDGSSLLIGLTLAGDTNLDGVVDATDLGDLALHWGTSAPWSGGDFDYNGVVDVNDLDLLAANWQAGTTAALALSDALARLGLPSVGIPEPATPSALALFLMALLSRRG
jgi:autotransporter-associated beta strand protein